MSGEPLTLSSKNVASVMLNVIHKLRDMPQDDPIVTSMYLSFLGVSDEQILEMGYPKPPPKVFIPAQSSYQGE